jgi:hypothetical protein
VIQRTNMLHITKLRDLNLSAGATPDRPDYISAASGLVRVGEYLYVVADDELHLAVFAEQRDQPGELLRLFPGDLPSKLKQRKKRKPDVEVLVLLPASAHHPHGALLALGSGSTAQRCRGALMSLTVAGQINQAPTQVDAAPLFAALEKRMGELNLEGAWISGSHLYLLQRGNKYGLNAVISLDWPMLCETLSHEAVLLPAPAHIHEMQLGALQGVSLCFSDAAALPNGRWLFSAVAEDTDNAFDDGAFAGAAIGMADAHHQVQWLQTVTPQRKIEGVALASHGEQTRLLMVTDADDSTHPAELFATEIKL